MAYAIGFQCTACGVCISTCPNGAIQGTYPNYYIEPLLCTECVLYADEPLCAAECPSSAIRQKPIKPGFSWTDFIPVKSIHPALRNHKLEHKRRRPT